MFIFAVSVLIFVLVYFAWQDRRAKEKRLEERLSRLEEQQKKDNQSIEETE
jgi:preprotein translocase subunit YajC